MVRLLVGFAGLVGVVSALPAQEISAEEKKDGFVSLFNGKDFTGWRFTDNSATPANWKVTDGLIKLSGGGKPHLASQWDYDDFEIRMEWRPLRQNYNSGFYIRSARNVGPNQINLAQKAAGNLMGGAKGGKAVPELQKPVMEWNEWRVRAVGDTLTFWCNGKQAWEVKDFKPARGYVGLQAEGAPIDFRNIRIKELGYEPLDASRQLASSGWKTEGDTLLASDASQRSWKRPARNFVVRLEWKAVKGAQGQVQLAGAKTRTAAVVLGDLPEGSGALPGLKSKPSKKADYPLEQWNYLEIEVKDNKARVWLNGTVVADKVDLTKAPELAEADSLQIVGSGGLQLRRLRLKEIKP